MGGLPVDHWYSPQSHVYHSDQKRPSIWTGIIPAMLNISIGQCAIVSTPANMSAFKYQWNQTIDVGTAGLLSKQWTSIRHILSLLVTANACVHVTAYAAVRRSLSRTYTAVVLGLLLRQYVSYQFGVWADMPLWYGFLPLWTSPYSKLIRHILS